MLRNEECHHLTAVGLSSGSWSDLFDAVFVDTPASAGGWVTLCRFEESFKIAGGKVSTQEARFGAPTHGHTGTVGFAETPAPLRTRQENVPLDKIHASNNIQTIEKANRINYLLQIELN